MLKLLALLLPLGLDSFAVAAALGVGGLPAERRVRVSLLFAAFEGGVPLIGLALGAPLGHTVGGAADYIAIAVLVGVGLYALLGDDDGEADKAAALERTQGVAAIALGLSISLDELAIGFTLGLLRLPVVAALVGIAVQAFVLSQVGLRSGARLGERFREGAERLAGLALIAVAVILLAGRLT